MNFESLANELILYLFEFVRTDYLFHAFHGLNSRFDSLLVHHFIIFGIDFRSFYSNDFVTICQEYLPTLIDKIPSLNLCDKMRSSRSLHRLDTHGFTLDQFVQLKSLSLSYLSYKQGEIFEKQVDKLLNTFQTPFWRDKHNWFVRCNWDPIDGSFSLYTLPYAFGKFRVYKQEFGKSTWSQEKTQQSYDAVRHLEYHVKPTKYSQLSDMQFYKLDKLEITFPVNDHFWSMVPALNQLTSCKIRSCDNSEQSKIQLEHLLSHASHLSFLDFSCIGIHISIEILSLKVKNTSIKRLDLRKYSTSYNEEECVQLSHSPLVMQCEELHISVEKRISICHLVKTMLNLRLLYVKCDEDKEPWQYLLEDDNEEENLEEDELISWLRQQLTDVRPLMEISRWRYNIVLRLL
ncbi:unnamed protein product [Rotaria sp. Silwood1]|nr:unnamed protein product [Rotaria sp. Silwood1]